MPQKIDKRARAALFRTRLAAAIKDAGSNQTALARETGVDRSTISQLLSDGGPRLPNAHVAGACAAALGVSCDWLLGLSERPENAAELLAASLAFSEAPRALVDEQILAWHREAEGYKIRHVPAALPDMLKTPEMLAWEYAMHLGQTADQAIAAATERLDWIRASSSDYEIALPCHELTCFRSLGGYYETLPPSLRDSQTAHMARLMEQLYPRLRVYLYDARKVFSAPVSIYGQRLAVIYLGTDYLIFRDSDRVGRITEHFHNLVRTAETDTRGVLQALRAAPPSTS